MNEDSRNQGCTVVREMFGAPMLEAMQGAEASGGFASAAAGFALGQCYGDIWSRPGLERKSRSLATLGMLMALRTPAEFKNHVHGALNNGCTVQEIEELLYQGIPYLGFASVAIAIQAAGEVLHERGLIGARDNPRAG